VDRHRTNPPSAQPQAPSGFSRSGWARLGPAALITLVLVIALVLVESLATAPPVPLVLELEATCPGTWTVLGQSQPLNYVVDAQGRFHGAVLEGTTLHISFAADPAAATAGPGTAPRAVALHWRFTQGAASRDGLVWGTQLELLAKAHEGDHD